MARLAIAALVALAACEDVDSFSGDPFPITYTSRGGAVTAEVQAPGEMPRAAVIEILSPLTVLDDGIATNAQRRALSLDLRGLTAGGGMVSRARFSGTVVEFHPCAAESCTVGDPAAPFPITATLGVDLLAGDALRFDFAARQLFVLPDIAGSPTERTDLCEGLFLEPFQGQGTLLLEGAEVTFSSRRAVVEACLGPNTTQFEVRRGGDALFVLATGIGPSLMTEAAYLRYRDGSTDAVADLATLPTATALVVSGPITGRVAVVPKIALVGTDPQEPRGPCRETYASTFLETAPSDTVCLENVECPCQRNDRSCSAPSVVMLDPLAGVTFLVVPDDTPLLQDLRAELRPLVGEIDGVIGADALAPVELDLDYPNDRMLWRCTTTEGCQVRPQFNGIAMQDEFVQCLGGS